MLNPFLLLLPFSWLYGKAARIDRARKLRAAREFPVPIISIGGITAGGSGKTPVTRELFRLLRKDYQVILLSRGYGRKESQPVIWREGEELPNPNRIGDEPALIARSVGINGDTFTGETDGGIIAVGPDRASLLESVLRTLPSTEDSRPRIVLLDDGFQHARLKRDLDIVIVDDQTAAERFLLPAGYLRERPEELARADILLTTSESARKFARRYARPNAHTFSVGFRTGDLLRREGSEWINDSAQPNRSVLLVTGIARPERVVKSAEERGCRILRRMTFGDHHRYTEKDVERILDASRSLGVDMILTTEKDAVKLEQFPALQKSLHVLTIAVEIPEMTSLLNIIHATAQRIS